MQGRIQGWAIRASAPRETYESNFFHHDFVQFGNRLDCQLKLDCQILLKSPHPLNLRVGSAPVYVACASEESELFLLSIS